MGQQTYNDGDVGGGTFIVPAGVTEITVFIIGASGAGAGGGAMEGGGGGGGAGCCIKTFSVTEDDEFDYVVGTGFSSGNGFDTTFDSMTAHGGTAGSGTSGGSGGTASGGDSNYTGGAGGAGSAFFGSNNGGGGGSSAGPASAGTAGGSGDTTHLGGTAPTSGGNGGNGGTSSSNGFTGGHGGGGGGGAALGGNGAAGSDGYIQIDWEDPSPPPDPEEPNCTPRGTGTTTGKLVQVSITAGADDGYWTYSNSFFDDTQLEFGSSHPEV